MIIASRKFDVLKTNICPRSEASSTLGARGFSSAVSGIGHVCIREPRGFSRLRRSCRRA